MKINYKAIDKNGEQLAGEIDALNQREAMRKLSDQGILVSEFVRPKEESATLYKRKLKQQDILLALYELSTLLESGISIAEAVSSLSETDKHPKLLAFFDKVHKQLKKGHSFSESIQQSSLTLPEYFYQLVESGELSGQLSQSIKQAVEQMEYEQQLATDFRNALIYPAILVFSGISAVLLIFIFVVPQFSTMLNKSQELPWLAEFVLGSGLWFHEHTFLALGLLLLLFMLPVMALRIAHIKHRIYNQIAHFPIIGDWITETETAKWANVMAAMLSSKVELISALALAQKGVKIQRRKQQISQVILAVRAGETLSKSLQENKVLTSTAYNLISVGEKSGKLAEMLRSVAKIYDSSSRTRMKRLLILIEPIAILLIGMVIGTLVIGIILAITSVNEISI